jgi:hypothetical protein
VFLQAFLILANNNHRMVIFDAIATALAFLNKSPPEEK